MKNLYRRYRPLKLEDVVGQEQVTGTLSASLKQGKIGHAYLFVGPRGCGKTSVARILAHEVNGFKYELEDDYIDIIEIDGASNRGIDNIRELREKVMIAPTSGKYKVYIIDEVHMLTKEAFNALLKTLEEPPEHAIFIMATTDAYKVPVTITSRAQTYTFKLADKEMMLSFLKSVAEQEKIDITDDALKIIVKQGGGSFRDSLSLLDQISTLSDKQINEELVVAALGLPQDEKITALLSSYDRGDFSGLTSILKDLLSSGIKADTLAEEIIATILEKPTPGHLALLAKLPEVRAPFAEAKLLVALAGAGVSQAQSMSPNAITSRPMQAKSAPRNGAARFATSTHPEAQSAASKKATPGIVGGSSEQQAPSTTKDERLASNAIFDWEGFVTKVRELSDAVYSQLVKTKYEYDGSTLDIYPGKKIVKSILSRENNKRILVSAAGGQTEIAIHDENDLPSNAKKDEMISKISDIMGGEVKNDSGGNPF